MSRKVKNVNPLVKKIFQESNIQNIADAPSSVATALEGFPMVIGIFSSDFICFNNMYYCIAFIKS